MKKYSSPLYECPLCGKNSVCRDETIALTSFPAKYLYKCLKEYNGCGKYITSK